MKIILKPYMRSKKHLRNIKGQAAILIIFVVGMVALAIGMSLTKTGFQENMMARGTAGSTKAFYVANSGIEEALYKMNSITDESLPYEEELVVIDSADEDKKGIATISITSAGIEEEDGGVITTKREIMSVGKYGNFVRRLRVVTQNTLIAPDFTRFIQAGDGGIQIGHNVHISSSEAGGNVNISSRSFVLGRDNGAESSCTNASTEIDGNVFAYGNIGKLVNNGSGPCIIGNAYAGSMEYCRVFGEIYSEVEPSVDCPYNTKCDTSSDPMCKRPDIDELSLPDIGATYIEDHLIKIEDSSWDGDCEIGGGVDDCSTPNDDGSSTIGNLIINGNLETNSNSTLRLSGHVLVRGDVTFDSNQEIEIDPTYENESSLIMLVKGKVNASANTHFYSDILGGVSRFLLVASEYESSDLSEYGLCEGSLGDNAINIEPNVQSILFYAMKGCAYVKATASEAFLGAILAEGVYIGNNVNIIYDSALLSAKFFLSGENAWEILSFTEE